MDLNILNKVAQQCESELREFRLSGDLNLLQVIIEKAIELDSLKDASQISHDFLQALTNNEKQAFYSITEEIGLLSGYISIVKMIQKTNLSRPVFTNVLQKMEKFGIAHIKNCGVKGTYIEFIIKVEEH